MAGQLKEIRDLPSASDITTGGGDFLHIKQGDVDRKIRVQDLFKWHTTDLSNPHNVTKAQVGLDQVVNSLQLQAANNLTDVTDTNIARNHLNVYSKPQVDTNIAAHANRVDNPHVVTKAQVGLSAVANFSYSGDYNNPSQSVYATIGAVNSVYNLLPQYVRAVRGMIMMWHGNTASIPAGWALCNGANGTPNLLDRFVVGAGSAYGWGATGGAATVGHSHGGAVQGTVLTEAQIPAHAHTIAGGGGSSGPRQAMAIDSSINPSHDWIGPRIGGVPSTYTTGGNQPHYHGLNIDGTTLENRPPYYALFYIMKL